MNNLKKLTADRLSILKTIKSSVPKDKDLLLQLSIQEHVLVHKRDIKLPLKTLKNMVSKSNAYINLIEGNPVTLLTEENEICPLKKLPICQKHVALCGHAFEKSAFESFIKKIKRCPVEGCEKMLIM